MTKTGKFFIGGLLLSILFSGCQSPEQKAIDEIDRTEKEIFSEEGMLDRNRVDELINIYVDYADTFKEDTLAPEYLFKAGDISMNTNRSHQAIRYYSRIIEDYPDYRKVPEALFLKGYVYENNLGRLDKAEVIYKEFLDKYPDNEFADDAEVSLKYLGKSPEELIELFQTEEGDTQPLEK
nr:tetratricopeptide repeat protein [Bacteroidota bacterium]